MGHGKGLRRRFEGGNDIITACLYGTKNNIFNSIFKIFIKSCFNSILLDQLEYLLFLSGQGAIFHLVSYCCRSPGKPVTEFLYLHN